MFTDSCDLLVNNSNSIRLLSLVKLYLGINLICLLNDQVLPNWNKPNKKFSNVLIIKISSIQSKTLPESQYVKISSIEAKTLPEFQYGFKSLSSFFEPC